MKITCEASLALHNATAHLVSGQYIAGDTNYYETGISTETANRIMEYAKAGETIRDVIIRLSQMCNLLNSISG